MKQLECNMEDAIDRRYTIGEVANMSGVTVRALRLYHRKGLVVPVGRSESGYRLYSDSNLLMLQQVLLFKELGFELAKIRSLVASDNFDVLQSLYLQRKHIDAELNRLNAISNLIDNTIQHIQGAYIMDNKNLYDGLAPDVAESYRTQAIDDWGIDAIIQSESYLKSLPESDFHGLAKEADEIRQQLFKLRMLGPADEQVVRLVGTYYNIIRRLWGTSHSTDSQSEQFAGLGELYRTDTRFKLVDGRYDAEFADFLASAMRNYADSILR
jgi:DNA-binding transcriptional MerR regulator